MSAASAQRIERSPPKANELSNQGQEDGGTVYFEVSGDGVRWSSYASTLLLIDASRVRVGLSAEGDSPAIGSATLVDNLDMLP